MARRAVPRREEPPPAAHAASADQLASQVVPRDAAGAPDPNGFIVTIAIGMSNTTHEFGAFERIEDVSRNRNARVVLMDTAYGGQTAADVANPNAAYWTTMMQRLAAMALAPNQVQVAWLKEANAFPPDDFPGHASILRDQLELIANNLHDKFPNLRLCYLSSRTYGGYGSLESINPEPQAYESGFSVKWLIEDQIAGKPELNFGQIAGPIRSPLLLWGPYLWADGTTPRSDGLAWLPDDFEADRVHPSPSGEAKVVGLLSSFFDAAPSARPWWPAVRTDATLVAVDAAKDAHVDAAQPSSNFGSAPLLVERGGTSPINLHLAFDVSATPRPYALTKLSARVGQGGGGRVSGVADTAWGEGSITWANAPAIGAALVEMPQSTRDGTIAASVGGAVNGDPDGWVGFALTTTASTVLAYPSRESGQPPRLVATVPCVNAADGDGDGITDLCDCAPADPSVFAPPSEISRLVWLDASTLGWDLDPSGPGTRYDVMSGVLADLPDYGTGTGDLCVADDSVASAVVDTTPLPAAGAGRFYLVRGDNVCGKGRYQTASDLRDRTTAVCP